MVLMSRKQGINYGVLRTHPKDGGLVHVLRKRQLHEDAMHGGVTIELLDQRDHLLLARRFSGVSVRMCTCACE